VGLTCWFLRVPGAQDQISGSIWGARCRLVTHLLFTLISFRGLLFIGRLEKSTHSLLGNRSSVARNSSRSLVVLRAEFVFGRGISAGPAYGDRGRHRGCASQLLENRGRQPIRPAGEEAQDQGGHVRVASPDGIHDTGWHGWNAEAGGRCGQQ
jgi:hypothetical protein